MCNTYAPRETAVELTPALGARDRTFQPTPAQPMMQLEVDYDKLQRADQELEQLHQDFERIKSRSRQLEATP